MKGANLGYCLFVSNPLAISHHVVMNASLQPQSPLNYPHFHMEPGYSQGSPCGFQPLSFGPVLPVTQRGTHAKENVLGIISNLLRRDKTAKSFL